MITNTALWPAMRSSPSAKPAMVAIRTDIGTTATSMMRLDLSRAAMLAVLKASRKLPHCGSLGQLNPLGIVP